MAALLPAGQAQAQDAKEQFFPLLAYRTGAYSPNGTPWANAKQDYIKMINARDGGINGVKITFEECETGYATDRGVECYERLKNKGPTGATLIDPQATGITFALTDKAPGDKIPLLTLGYGLAASQDGMAFKWNFPLLGSYWTAADILIQHIGKKEGGVDKLKGKKIALVYHDSPFGKEPIPLLEERAKMHGFELSKLPVTASRRRAEVGMAAGSPAAAGLCPAVGLGRDELDRAQGSAGHRLPARQDVRRLVVRRGARRQGHRRRRQGLQRADHAIRRRPGQGPPGHHQARPRQGRGKRAARRDRHRALQPRPAHPDAGRSRRCARAQERFGKGKPMTGEQVRWGLENLSLDQKKLDALGFAGMMRPVSTSCADHMGSTWARVHTWDGKKWEYSSDWLEADQQILKPMVKAAADKYLAEKKLERRTAQDCQS